jgi:hypothetical protein
VSQFLEFFSSSGTLVRASRFLLARKESNTLTLWKTKRSSESRYPGTVSLVVEAFLLHLWIPKDFL